jgi:predicted nucleotidyltransferase
VTETFEELYAPLLKDVFKTHAQKQLDLGVDALASIRIYAEQGKPEFTLAYLLLIDLPEDEKRELLAYSYERRATLSEQKAKQFNTQFHRPFPLIKLEAQKDRIAARSIRQGKQVRTGSSKIPPSL